MNHIMTIENFEWSLAKPRKFCLHPHSSHRNTTLHAYVSFEKIRHVLSFQNLRKLHSSQPIYIHKLETGNWKFTIPKFSQIPISVALKSANQGQLKFGTAIRYSVCTDKIHTTPSTK